MHQPLFAVYLGRGLADEAEITFGDIRAERAASPFTWVNVSEEGYWQFQFTDFLVDDIKPMPRFYYNQNMANTLGVSLLQKKMHPRFFRRVR